MNAAKYILSQIVIFGISFLLLWCTEVPEELPPTPCLKQVDDSFKSRYPEAVHTVWSKGRDTEGKSYYIADFEYDTTVAQAWFDCNGNWMLSEYACRFSQLEAPVREAFLRSPYASQNISKSRLLERKGMKQLYVLCLPEETQHVNLYYTPEGDFVRSLASRQEHEEEACVEYPKEIPALMKERVSSLFEKAEIIDFWLGPFSQNIGVMDEGKFRTVALDHQSQWICTFWPLSAEEVPQAVEDNFYASLNRLGYPVRQLRNVCMMQDRKSLYYLFYFEGEKGDEQLAILFESGELYGIIR
ncbi:MAG: PepSY-like domain-containing protein [Tannerella sp.]|jgi:hypothetical protein|nr:PepSY-like domain-containing protein [Tannerella sp.]